jgi:hypothetical protein
MATSFGIGLVLPNMCVRHFIILKTLNKFLSKKKIIVEIGAPMEH